MDELFATRLFQILLLLLLSGLFSSGSHVFCLDFVFSFKHGYLHTSVYIPSAILITDNVCNVSWIICFLHLIVLPFYVAKYSLPLEPPVSLLSMQCSVILYSDSVLITRV